PLLVFIAATLLSGAASLLLCESLSAQPENEKFQKKIEFTRLASTLITNKYQRRLIQFILYMSFESLIISSIIISAQTMDSLSISVFGKTCGIGIYPTRGFFCVSEQSSIGSPFGSSFMLLTIGYFVTLVTVVPLGVMELADNIKVQVASFLMLIFILTTWMITFIIHGLQSDRVPVIGRDQSQVVGTILYNYAFITTVPSWVNEMNPAVSIRKCVWYSVIISTFSYISLGILGGMAYQMNATSNIIAVINNSNQRTVISLITTYLFPIAVLITSIPEHPFFYPARYLGFNFILPFWLFYLSQTQKPVKDDSNMNKSTLEKSTISRKPSTISEVISIKSILMTDEHPPFPIVVSPPSPGLKPIHDSGHLTPHTPGTPRRRRSRSPNRSRSRSRSSSKIGVDSIEVHQMHSPENHFDIIVVNTDALCNNSKLTDSPTFLSVPSPRTDSPTFLNVPSSRTDSPTFLNVPSPRSDIGVENRDRDLSCSPSGHTLSVATESDTRGYLSAPPSLISRTSFSRRKSPSRPTIVIAPAITISDEACDGDKNDLSIHSSVTCPPSPISTYEEKISASFTESDRVGNVDPFKAFPGLETRHKIRIAIFSGAFAILMACGILTYDFVELGMGTN
ncbi:5394_t:CDS:2, partial [Scutellospora calospora]